MDLRAGYRGKGGGHVYYPCRDMMVVPQGSLMVGAKNRNIKILESNASAILTVSRSI